MSATVFVIVSIVTLIAGLAAFSLSTLRHAKQMRLSFQPRARLLLKITGSMLLAVSLGASLWLNPQLGALYWCAGFAACGLAITAFYSSR